WRRWRAAPSRRPCSPSCRSACARSRPRAATRARPIFPRCSTAAGSARARTARWGSPARCCCSLRCSRRSRWCCPRRRWATRTTKARRPRRQEPAQTQRDGAHALRLRRYRSAGESEAAMKSLYLWPEQTARSLAVLWVASVVFLGAAREPMLALLRSLGQHVAEACNGLARSCDSAAQKLRTRAHGALLAAGKLEAQGRLGREISRVDSAFSERLGQYS